MNQKKLGTRIADLESQLGQAQHELKSLKNQLTSAEQAKKVAQDQLEKKSKIKKHQKAPEAPVSIQEKHSTPVAKQTMNKKESKITYEEPDDVQQETDVFEVPVEKVTVEAKCESNLPPVQDEELKPILADSSDALDLDNSPPDELALKNEEIKMLLAKLDEKDKELELSREENENLKTQLNDKSVKISSAESEIEKLTTRANKVDQELEESKRNAVQLSVKLEATEKAKEELENEMTRLRVQTEQWRKAADAAASVLAGGAEMNGRGISERCGSMDKHYGSVFEHGGYGGYVGSPGLVDDDDIFGSGKRKGSGMKMFGDLWKKKGQK